MYYFPGLVHFLFVDRTNHQVVAPTIIPLHGQLNEEQGGDHPEYSVKFIEEKVWDMCRHVQQTVSEGFSSMMVRCAGDGTV